MMSSMDAFAYIIPGFFFLIGVCMGSFGNVIIFRTPEGKSIRGRSVCRHCGKELRAWELVPLLSFLFLRGRCARCKNPLSWQYPLVELASGLLFLTAISYLQYFHVALLLGAILWLLLLIAVIDLRTKMISDALNIPFAILSLIYSLVHGIFPWVAILVGAGFFLLQWAVSRGKWVGSGDIILAAGMGALLGTWQKTLVFLFLSYIIGALVAVVLMARGSASRKDMMAFGPFLIIGGIVAFFFGDWILEFYI
jgi:prepilin signal peptidase PulO-like enzyme (type II secretory pathway)